MKLVVALAVALFVCSDAALAACVMATGTWTGNGTGTAISGGTGCSGAGASTAYEIPSGVTVTDSGGLATATGTVTVQAGASPGALILTINVSTAANVILDGQLETCVTDAASCVIGGDTAQNLVALDTWTDYAITINSNGEEATVTGDETTTALTHDGTWDGMIDDSQVGVFWDIDGDESNDSWAMRSRPFFNVQSVNDAGDTVTFTTEVGTSYAGVAAVHQFKETIALCQVTLGTQTQTVADGANTDADTAAGTYPEGGSELDDNYATKLDYLNTLTLQTASLPGWKNGGNNATGELVGMTIYLESSGTDAFPYTIIDSADGGAGSDVVTVWPPLRKADITTGAQTCTVGWGWGTGSNEGGGVGDIGPGAREFFTYTPAQLYTTTESTTLTFTGATAGLSGNFGMIGVFEGVAGWAPLILMDATVTTAYELAWSWYVGGSGDNSATTAGSSCAGTAFVLNNSANYKMRSVQISHDAEGTNCGGTGDDTASLQNTSSLHGIIVDTADTATVTLIGIRCFALGDICIGLKDEHGTGVGDTAEGGVLTMTDIGCTWGTNDACFKNGVRDDITVKLDKMYMVNWQARAGMCIVGATYSNGEWCDLDADCGAGGACIEAGTQPAAITYSLGRPLTATNIAVIAPDAEGALFSGLEGSNTLSIRGAFILDPRTDAAIDADVTWPSLYSQVWDADAVTAPIATQPGYIGHSITRHYVGRTRVQNKSATIAPLRFDGDRAVNDPYHFRMADNVFYDVTEKTDGDFVNLVDAAEEGDTVVIQNNWVDRSENADTEDFFLNSNVALLDGANMVFGGNIITNYRYIMDCTGTVAETPLFGRNVFAVSSGINPSVRGIDNVCIGSDSSRNYEEGKIIEATRFDTFRWGASGRIGTTRIGPSLGAGYAQHPWLTRLGFESQVAGSGVSFDPTRPHANHPNGATD